ncbi:hypothetical protein JY506_04160 [Corynebacterium amycolatum]|uniref:hypothetical protein n=1 Tax=Corynebacterium amycolatum TaxID=43765 RepID=UPI00211A55E1|nr:hypothetical protein [Corynebacterium amycolatum]MCQ9171521.1 hypothetical protein [Corynebacterium amycolatum]
MNTADEFPLHRRLALPPQSATYRAECFEDLDLIRTILCHPTIGRRHSPGALDHSFSLPDGPVVTVRASRIALPRALVSQLADVHAEYFVLKDEPMFMYSVSVKVESSSEVVLRGIGGSNRTREENRRRTRAVAEALHRAQDCSKIHENGTDLALPGRRYSWIGTRDARPLPCPNELFSSRSSAA